MSDNAEKMQAKTVITSHVNADFDALAAIVGAGKLYPGAVLLFPGSQEKNLRHFFIESPPTSSTSSHQGHRSWTRWSGWWHRGHQAALPPAPRAHAILDRPGIEIHAYDHHPDTDEDLESSLEVVKPWGSTTLPSCARDKKRGIELYRGRGHHLGLGLFEDTGSFTFSSTTEHDFLAAAWLRSMAWTWTSSPTS